MNYDDVLETILLFKLPGNIREHLARQHFDDNWLLSTFHTIFTEINIKESGTLNMSDWKLYCIGLQHRCLQVQRVATEITENTH